MMKKHFFLAALVFSTLLAGCVTPPAVKEASTQHAANLNQLELLAAKYRSQVEADFDRRIGLQKQAYVAQRLAAKIDKMTDDLAAATAGAAQPNVEDKPSRDFIKFAVELSEEYKFEADNFDFWLKSDGATLDSKKQNLKTQSATIERLIATLKNENPAGERDADVRRAERALKGLTAALVAGPDELAHVVAAVAFADQKKQRLAKVDLLLAQIRVMKSFHAVVDDYLAIDATIDARAIARAAAAGSKLDLSGLPEMQKALGGK